MDLINSFKIGLYLFILGLDEIKKFRKHPTIPLMF